MIYPPSFPLDVENDAEQRIYDNFEF